MAGQQHDHVRLVGRYKVKCRRQRGNRSIDRFTGQAVAAGSGVDIIDIATVLDGRADHAAVKDQVAVIIDTKAIAVD